MFVNGLLTERYRSRTSEAGSFPAVSLAKFSALEAVTYLEMFSANNVMYALLYGIYFRMLTTAHDLGGGVRYC